MSRGRGYRRLWAGNAASNFGDGIRYIVIQLSATAPTRSPLPVAGLSMLFSAAKFQVLLPVGAIVDRMDRKAILWIPNLGRSVLLAALAAPVATGPESMPALYVAFALVGVLETAADNSALSTLPSLVGSKDLDRANSQIAATQLVAEKFLGPPLGGLMFAAAAVPS
ncbi:hypothetical protein DQ353_00745 [Arthrobacter sp. AQ5-05]|uniref:MFS transporter n=1 Tax=Arthrobacter sp. AQ5-05 TaxID=2184581 RepID=UPI000DCB9313|nr:MFS transporter [Arthrobacter sp. AQ5-05]RAX50956.1 hypothetical protein DQ353_00745 [Arthrobacter sp. AQ5-05]